MSIRTLPEKAVKQLFRAMLSLQTGEECMAFLDDLCTLSEMNAFAQRLEVAKRLRCGGTYMDIQAETGAPSATITRVKRLLAKENSGFHMVLERIEKRV